MVKNQTGGNKQKSQARKYSVNVRENKLRLTEDECEKYAQVVSLLGNGMCYVIIDNNTKLFVTAMTNASKPDALYYDSATKEVTYSTPAPIPNYGQATLNGVTGVVVPNLNVTTTSIITVTNSTGANPPNFTNSGFLVVGDIVANVSFTVFSSNALDVNQVNWLISNP